jgi:predicted Zn-dependent peptidase
MFHRVREQLGAAYYIHSGTDFFTDHGFMGIAMGLNKEKLYQAIEAAIAELRKIKDELVPADELEKIKSHIAGNLVLGLETSNALASFYGDQEILERSIMTPEEILAKINAVTAEEVRDVAREIFKNDGMNLAVIGPVEDKAKLEALLRID